MPIAVPTAVSASANRMLTRNPYSSRATMSCPRLSVPSQFFAPGGAGLAIFWK